MKLLLVRNLFMGLLCLTLASCGFCGFHLRNYQQIPPELQHMAIQSLNPYDPFIIQLKEVLQSSDVVIEDNPKLAPVTLRILGTALDQQLTSISSNTLVLTYNLQYHVSFELETSQGKIIYGPQTVTTNSSYTLSQNQVLGDNNIFDMQEQNMIREAIGLMLNRLGSLEVRQALAQIRITPQKNH